MRNAGLDKAQLGIKIDSRNINNIRYADDTTLTAESKEKLKSLLMKVKEEREKNWLKVQHSENTEEPDSKLPTSTDSLTRQEFQKNMYFHFIN